MSRNLTDITDQVFGKWTALRRSHFGKRHRAFWVCRCECGTERAVDISNLLTDKSKSCGCVWLSQNGLSTNDEYSVYRSMLNRCFDTEDKFFHRYGARGITVCGRWLGRNGLKNFLADMGKQPSKRHQISRKDNDGPYAPENCCWETCKQNMRNMSRNHLLTYHGRTMPLEAWAEEIGIASNTLLYRVRRGWTIGRAIRASLRPRKYTVGDETRTLTEWASHLGVKRDTLKMRLLRGSEPEQALTTLGT